VADDRRPKPMSADMPDAPGGEAPPEAAAPAPGRSPGPTQPALELARLFVALLQEQTAHNLEAMLALGRTTDWREAAQMQRDYVRASVERMSRFTERYAELVEQLARDPGPNGDGTIDRAA
jgi:hypothetical protein